MDLWHYVVVRLCARVYTHSYAYCIFTMRTHVHTAAAAAAGNFEANGISSSELEMSPDVAKDSGVRGVSSRDRSPVARESESERQRGREGEQVKCVRSTCTLYVIHDRVCIDRQPE